MTVRIDWDTAQLDNMLRGPTGLVAKDTARRAVKVESRAKLNASGRPGPEVETGRLRSSIHWELRNDGGVYAVVGTDVEYALWVERGHRVVRNGRTVGMAPPYPYLGRALSAAV